MGFLDRLRGEHSALQNDWKELTSISQLEILEELSFYKPVVIFKHSTRCGTSVGAKFRLESDWNFDVSQLAFYYLDLLQYRNVSNEIASRYGIYHQSPQLIMLSHGKAVMSTSHHNITTHWLAQVLEKII